MKNNDVVFNELHNLTGELNLQLAMPSTLSGNESNRWFALTDVWDSMLDNGTYDLFYAAIHHVMWGMRPDMKQSSVFWEIVSHIENELLGEGEAWKAWIKTPAFKNAFGYVTSEMDPDIDDECIYRHSIEHYHYRRYRTESAILYSKPTYSKYDADYGLFSDIYEEIIHRLIPESAGWSDADWADENTIHNTLCKHYGVDYREDPDQYDILIMMLTHLWFDKGYPAVIWPAMNLQKLPYSLAAVIWPENTQATIEQLFIDAYEKTRAYEEAGRPNDRDLQVYIHATSVYNYADLRLSWLYQHVYRWMTENNCTLQNSTIIKQILFNLALCT